MVNQLYIIKRFPSERKALPIDCIAMCIYIISNLIKTVWGVAQNRPFHLKSPCVRFDSMLGCLYLNLYGSKVPDMQQIVMSSMPILPWFSVYFYGKMYLVWMKYVFFCVQNWWARGNIHFFTSKRNLPTLPGSLCVNKTWSTPSITYLVSPSWPTTEWRVRNHQAPDHKWVQQSLCFRMWKVMFSQEMKGTLLNFA